MAFKEKVEQQITTTVDKSRLYHLGTNTEILEHISESINENQTELPNDKVTDFGGH